MGENHMNAELVRCPWALNSAIERDYHDTEWGRPLHDERRLFEMLILEGQQAGLSWYTILSKRTHYRQAYDHFDAAKIAAYGDDKVAALLANPGIVRNRLKILSAIGNARAYLGLLESGTTLDGYMWDFVDGRPIVNHWDSPDQIPVNTPLSDQISKDLKKRGFKFVGSTIIYSYLQAAGLVDDHLRDCYLRKGQ
jgi:DNA-3-methyladenine glycosylase I